MNAYELAEHAEGLAYEIPADWSSGEPKNIATDIANMLRQQADRIKDLEKLLEHSVGADCREMRYIQEIENRDARIAELEKEADRLSNHADELRKVHADRIAELEKELYFKNYYEELPDTPVGIIGKIGDSPIHDLVHRTTPKIKELSNEEIERIYYKTLNRFDFARAILKKASEK